MVVLIGGRKHFAIIPDDDPPLRSRACAENPLVVESVPDHLELSIDIKGVKLRARGSYAFRIVLVAAVVAVLWKFAL